MRRLKAMSQAKSIAKPSAKSAALSGTALTLSLALGLSIGLGGHGPAAAQEPGALTPPDVRAEIAVPATERYAIVVGNGDYEKVSDLGNAIHDAKAMASFLRGHGFHVVEAIDVTKKGFEELFQRAVMDIPENAEVLFYYAGHGIQIGRRNYIIPTDADLSNATDTPFETITLDHVVEILGARARLNLVILDSCRNNPFTDAKMLTEIDPTLYEARDGFSAMSAPINTLVAFATSPGFVAYDGTGGNSPYTSALIELGTDGADESIGQVLERVRRAVYEKTGGAQVPWESSTLVEPFRFASGTRGVTIIGATSAVEPTPVPETPVADPTPVPETPTVTAPERAVDAASVEVTSGDGRSLALSGPLERRIALGAGLAGALTLAESDTVSLSGAVQDGRLVLDLGDEGVRDYAGEALAPADLPALVFELSPVPRRVSGKREDYAATGAFEVSIASASGTVALEAAMQLTPDPCDFQAGDWLDPDGTGLARYPNELEPDAAYAACKAAVEAHPENGRFLYQFGRAAQALRRYEEAKPAFEKAAELGHVRALHALGDLADVSVGAEGGGTVGGAGEAALDYYRRGVQAGDPYAFHALGKQYLRYGADDAQRRYGFELLTRALELGHTFSMNELGYYFIRDDSPNYQPERGLRYLQESAARQDIYGFHNLGLVYDRGLAGVNSDPQTAYQWYVKASDGGHPESPANIGRMFFDGEIGGAQDLAEAVKWFDVALARGNASSGANAAWILSQVQPDGYTLADAALRAAKVMALRDPDAAARAGEILAALDTKTVDRATQMILKELGEEITVDGVVGPDTRGTIERLMAGKGLGPVPTDPRDRAVAVARLYWMNNRFRVDLY